MYLLIAILISILIGFIRRGSIKSIFEHPYKKWYLGLIGVIILGSLNYFYLFANELGRFIPYLPILNFVGYLFLLLMFIFNLDDIFSILIALGITFDFIVTFINAGFMPVAQGVVDIMPQNAPLTQSLINGTNVTYAIMQTESTLLTFMGLILPIPVLTRYVVLAGTIPALSIGRTFILVGMLGLVQSAMKLPRKEKKPKQKVMQQAEKPKTEVKTKEETQKSVPPRSNTKFDSRTEELFFEEYPLPKDPLDRIFADDQETQKTKHIKNISELRKTKTETIEIDSDLDRDVEMLTKPLGTGFINSKEVREHLEKGETEEATEQIDGFFASEFLKDKEKQPVQTEEIFTAVPEETEEISPQEESTSEPQATDFVLVEPDGETNTQTVNISKETAPELSEATIELLNPQDVFFDVDQYNLFLESIKDEDFKKEIEAKLAELTNKKKQPKDEETIVKEPEQVQETISTEPNEEVLEETKTEETEQPVRRKRKHRRNVALLNSEKEESVPEEVIDLTDSTQEVVITPEEIESEPEAEEIQIVESEEAVAKEEAEKKEPKQASVIELPQEPEIEEKTEPIEVKEKNQEVQTQPEKENIKEQTAENPSIEETEVIELESPKEKSEQEETQEVITSEETKETQETESPAEIKETQDIETPEITSEEKVSEKEILPQKTEEISEKEAELSTEAENSDTIEVQEDEEGLSEIESVKLEDNKDQMTDEEMTAQEKSENSDRLSDIIFDDIKVNGESVSADAINLDSLDIEMLEKAMNDSTYVSTKRGSFIQDEGSGYFVNKAYKEEKANMDKSEEEMLNVWAQVSQENQNRKMNRRRQASRNYENLNPFSSPQSNETVVEETLVETPTPNQTPQVEIKAQNQTPTGKDVQSMTNEERRAAGYEFVSIEVNGKTISFWQKKN